MAIRTSSLISSSLNVAGGDVVPNLVIAKLDRLARTLDLGRPVALMLLLILHLIPDADDPPEVVRSLLAEDGAVLL